MNLSGNQGIAAAQALIQLGSLKMKPGPSQSKAEAIEYFEKAGKLGSKLGKDMAIGLNDFSQLCGSAVNQMMNACFFSEDGQDP